MDQQPQRVARVLKGHNNTISSLASTPAGKLISGSWDGTVRVWDTVTGAGPCFLAQETVPRIGGGAATIIRRAPAPRACAPGLLVAEQQRIHDFTIMGTTIAAPPEPLVPPCFRGVRGCAGGP